MSMLKTFFELEIDENGKVKPENEKENPKLFEGLKISGFPEAMEYLGQHPVISINFFNAKKDTWEETYQAIKTILSEIYTNFIFLLKDDFLDDDQKIIFKTIKSKTSIFAEEHICLKKLSYYLAIFYDRKTVILLDEYDTVLTHAFINGYYDQALSFFRSFLTSTFKDNANLRLGCLTGVFGKDQEDALTDANNISVYGVTDDKFSSFFGFTGEEALDVAARSGSADKMDEIREWCGGWRFGKTEIHNPWSILNYIRNNCEPRFCRVNADGQELPLRLISKSGSSIKKDFETLLNGGILEKTLREGIDLRNPRSAAEAVWTVLLCSGFLAATDESEYGSNVWKLKLPNKETAELFGRMAMDAAALAFKEGAAGFGETAGSLLN
jgi:hypothetical protein